MEEIGFVGRLLGWYMNPKRKFWELGLLAKSSHVLELMLPLLFDIGSFIYATTWILSVPISLFLHYPVWVLSFVDLLAIFMVGQLLMVNSQIIYTYKRRPSMPRRFLNATKPILLVGDAVAFVCLVGWAFQLPRTLIILPALSLSVWSWVLTWRFLGSKEERARFFEGLYSRLILIRLGRKIKTILGEPHYH